MKNKLFSILKQKQSKGFTLVELLIVIAIIAILVLIVIVAIDPIERIHDTNDRRAESSVRQVATAVEGCLARNNVNFTLCDSVDDLTASTGTEGNPWVRDQSLILDGDGDGQVGIYSASGEVSLCMNGGTGHSAQWNTTSGTLTHEEAACG